MRGRSQSPVLPKNILIVIKALDIPPNCKNLKTDYICPHVLGRALDSECPGLHWNPDSDASCIVRP